MNKTSLDAYYALKAQRALQPMERKVLDTLGDGALTREEIAVAAGMKMSSVCGRVASLRKAGLVQSFGERRSPEGFKQELLQAVLP